MVRCIGELYVDNKNITLEESMKVGINLLVLKQYSGIACFAENILEQLFELEAVFYVYYTDELPFAFHDIKSNVILCKVNTSFSKVLYQQLSFPFRVLRDELDVLVCFTPIHPIILAKKNMIFMYDCAYHNFPENASGFFRLCLIKIMYWCGIRFSQKVVSVSNSAAREIESRYSLEPSSVDVVYGALPNLPMVQFDFIADTLGKYNLTEEGYIFSIGNGMRHKNIYRTIEAFGLLRSNNTIVTKLVIAGKMTEKIQSEVNRIIAELALQDYVKTIGYVSQEEKVALIKSSIGFSFVSLYEGFGLPILEAQSLGVPVITANQSAMPEIAGDAAILVDPYDINSIAQGMKALVELTSAEKKRATYRVKNNLNRFSWQGSATVLMDILKRSI